MFYSIAMMLLTATADAQECTVEGYDPENPWPDECCDYPPPEPKICPIQAVASDGAPAAWLGEDSTVYNWRAKVRGAWNTNNISEVDVNGETIEPDFQYFKVPVSGSSRTPLSASGSTGNYEISCGIETSGEIACWGSPAEAVTGRPSGANFASGLVTHSHNSVGGTNAVTFAALDNSGAIEMWGTCGGTLCSGKPTSACTPRQHSTEPCRVPSTSRAA